jgi:hypothetical protein
MIVKIHECAVSTNRPACAATLRTAALPGFELTCSLASNDGLEFTP